MAEHPGREHARRMIREGGYHERKHGDIHEDSAADAKMVRSAISQHDIQLHGGKKTHLRLKSGGRVPGGEAECRPDKRARGGGMAEIGATKGIGAEHREETVGAWKPAHLARGGPVKGGKKVIVNVHAAPAGDPQREAQAAHAGRQQGMQLGARMGAQAAAQRMAGAGGAPGGPPRPPMPPPGMAPPGAGGPPGAMPPRPMPPPGAGGPPGGPPGMMARGGAMRRDIHGRFAGGKV